MREVKYNKEELKKLRESLSSESLKTVNIRIDFSGVPDIGPWITNLINSKLGQPFSDYRIEASQSVTYDSQSLIALSDLLGIPVEKLCEMPLHILDDGNLNNLSDQLQLQITNVSAQLLIRCQDYKNIKPYLQWVMELTDDLKTSFRTFRLRRFGIRKLDGFMSTNLGDLNKWLEGSMFYSSSALHMADDLYESKYEDNFMIKGKVPMAIWSSRLFRVGKSGNKKAFQAVIDIQGNISADTLADIYQKNTVELSEIASEMNDRLFWMFLHYITEEYILTHKKV